MSVQYVNSALIIIGNLHLSPETLGQIKEQFKILTDSVVGSLQELLSPLFCKLFARYDFTCKIFHAF